MFTIPISAHSLWQGAGQEVLNEQLESGSFPQRLEVMVWQKDPPTFVKWTRESRKEENHLSGAGSYPWCSLQQSLTLQCWLPVSLCGALWPWLLPCLPLWGENSSWAAKKSILAMAQQEILPFCCPRCVCPVRKKSAWNLPQPLKTEMGMAHLSVHWIGIESSYSLVKPQVWRMSEPWIWHFRNTTFWSASLEPVKTLQIKPDLWFSPLPYRAALISEPWVYQTEAALLPPTEKYCHQDDVKQGNFAEALIWNVLFQGRVFACFHVYI